MLGAILLPALAVHPVFAGNNDSPGTAVAEITKWRKEVNEANELWLKQDTDKGISKFENLLRHTELVFGKNSPEVGVVVCPIGFLYCKRGDFERGLPYLERSLKLVSQLPDNVKNLQTKAELYWGLGLSYSARFELDRAIPAFNESLKTPREIGGC